MDYDELGRGVFRGFCALTACVALYALLCCVGAQAKQAPIPLDESPPCAHTEPLPPECEPPDRPKEPEKPAPRKATPVKTTPRQTTPATEVPEAGMQSLGVFRITEYCPCTICNSGYTGTATGAPLVPGVTIAVDPRVIAYGTRVYIDGYGWRVAQDTGGGRGNWIDILVSSHADAQSVEGNTKREVWK